jgi:hypothetical protein
MEDETAAAAAASEDPGSALPADKESQIFSYGEENVAGNLSATTSHTISVGSIPSAGAEELDRIFAADRGGEGKHSGDRERLGVRLRRAGQNRQSRRSGEQKSFRRRDHVFPLFA